MTGRPHSMVHSITSEACKDPLIGASIEPEPEYPLEHQTYYPGVLTPSGHYWVI